MSDIKLDRRPFLLGAGAVALAATGASTVALAQGRSPTGISLPVNGTTSQGQPVFGTFSPTNAVVQNGALFVEGLLRLAGGGTQRILAPAAIGAAATCNVLNLVLGPLHLNILGLVIDLNQIVLNITASPAGGLLGTLLCSLAGGTTLDQIAAILNQILDLFR